MSQTKVSVTSVTKSILIMMSILCRTRLSLMSKQGVIVRREMVHKAYVR